MLTSQPQAPALDPTALRLGALALFPSARWASLNGSDLDLSGTEFALLWTLACGHDTAVSVGALLRAAGWEESTAALIYLDLYLRYLREKLGDDPAKPCSLVAVRRSGFMLVTSALDRSSGVAAPSGELRAGAL